MTPDCDYQVQTSYVLRTVIYNDPRIHDPKTCSSCKFCLSLHVMNRMMGRVGRGAVFIASDSLNISLDNSNWVWFVSFSKHQVKSNAISFRQCTFGSVVTTIFFVEKLDIWIYATMYSLHPFADLVSEGDIPRCSENS